MTIVAPRVSRGVVYVPAVYVTAIERDIETHGDYDAYCAAIANRRAGRVAPVLGAGCAWSRDVWDAVLNRRANGED